MANLYIRYDDNGQLTERTTELGDCVVWDELLVNFQEFIRGLGYVIPYNFELNFVCDKCGLTHADHKQEKWCTVEDDNESDS